MIPRLSRFLGIQPQLPPSHDRVSQLREIASVSPLDSPSYSSSPLPPSISYNGGRQFYSTRLNDKSRTPSPADPNHHSNLNTTFYHSLNIPQRQRTWHLPMMGQRRMPMILPSKKLPTVPPTTMTMPKLNGLRLADGIAQFPRICHSPSYYRRESLASPYDESDGRSFEEFVDDPVQYPTSFNGVGVGPSSSFQRPRTLPIVGSHVPLTNSPLYPDSIDEDDLDRNFLRPARYLPSTEFVKKQNHKHRFLKNNSSFDDRNVDSPMSIPSPPTMPVAEYPSNGVRYSSLNKSSNGKKPTDYARSRYRPNVIRAQPGNVPLSGSDQEEWC